MLIPFESEFAGVAEQGHSHKPTLATVFDYSCALAQGDWCPGPALTCGQVRCHRNLNIDGRQGEYERFPALIAELIALKVDVIVTAGTPASLAVKKAITSIPLIMVAVGEPVATGLVASLGRPGGNITGLTSMSSEMEGKRLELLKEVVPKISHVAVLWNAASPIRSPPPGGSSSPP